SPLWSICLFSSALALKCTSPFSVTGNRHSAYISFVKLHDQLCPVRLFAGPEALGKCNPLELLLAGTMDRQNRTRALPGHPYPAIPVGSIDQCPSSGIGIEHLLRRVSIGIVQSDRDDSMSWIHLGQPITLQRASSAMMRHFQDVDSFSPTGLIHARQSLLFHIGCEQHPVVTTRQLQNDRTIVERMPCSPSST